MNDARMMFRVEEKGEDGIGRVSDGDERCEEIPKNREDKRISKRGRIERRELKRKMK